MKMEIKTKGKVRQLFCRHNYQEGIVSKPGSPVFFNLSGETYTTICTKCGKIKGTRFIRNFDGS